MEPHVFETLLAFMYTDSLPEVMRRNEEQDAVYQHLLVAADSYGVERLKLMCEEKLCERVSAGTASTVLALAEQHQCHGLRKACLDIIGSAANRMAFVSDDGFEDLCRSCPSLIKDLIIAGSPP
jgi:speckle-type POZ protein